MSATPSPAPGEHSALMRRLEEMPLDTLKAIITNQLDLEIRLKHKELALTDEEIGRCEAQMITLRKFFKIPQNVDFDNEPNGFTHKYSNILGRALEVNYEKMQRVASIVDAAKGDGAAAAVYSSPLPLLDAPQGIDGATHSYRTRSTTSSLRPSSCSRKTTYGCLYRRSDGVITKLTCPTCLRSNFLSAQGFLNHNRIAHSRDFTSQDSAALQCGECLQEEEQDEEGLASILALKAKGLDPSRHLNTTEVLFTKLASFDQFRQIQDQVQLQEQREAALQRQRQQQAQRQQQQAGAGPHAQPRRKSNDLLMQKLIAKGITSTKADYDNMVREAMSEVKDAHLLNGEVDVADNSDSDGPGTELEETRDKLRRKSRGGVGISKPPTVSTKNNKNSALPKLKLKLRKMSDAK
jgi:ADA HAT complex component 1